MEQDHCVGYEDLSGNTWEWTSGVYDDGEHKFAIFNSGLSLICILLCTRSLACLLGFKNLLNYHYLIAELLTATNIELQHFTLKNNYHWKLQSMCRSIK